LAKGQLDKWMEIVKMTQTQAVAAMPAGDGKTEAGAEKADAAPVTSPPESDKQTPAAASAPSAPTAPVASAAPAPAALFAPTADEELRAKVLLALLLPRCRCPRCLPCCTF
jgi:hypothetical protein